MTFKKLYFFINRIDEINLDQVKKTGAILIIRKPEKNSHKNLRNFVLNCRKKKISFFVANNVKLLFSLKTNNLYISAWNKGFYKHLKILNKNIQIIGSAHNVKEIKEKIDQGCSQIFLSRIFKTNYPLKKTFLGKIKFNLLTRYFQVGYVTLGGIKSKNFNQTKDLNIVGCAISSDKKKAGKYIPAFFKKTF